MFGAILKVTDSSFQKGMIICRSIYVTKVMNLLAFIFEQPSYCHLSQSTFHLRSLYFQYMSLDISTLHQSQYLSQVVSTSLASRR